MKHPSELMTPTVLGIISHELRSPLAAIKGFTSTLLRYGDQLAATERRDFLREIDVASDRLNHVVEHLLILTELTTVSSLRELQPLDISALARDTLRIAEQRAVVAGAPSFTFVYAPSASVWDDGGALVGGDSALLHLLLGELLENAIKFSPAGGTITVTLGEMTAREMSADHAPEMPGTSWLYVGVQDTGIGIPHEYHEQIFAPFFVVDDQLTRAVGGMGIGLALCQRIARLHGGTLTVTSQPGIGSMARFALPPLSPGDAQAAPYLPLMQPL